AKIPFATIVFKDADGRAKLASSSDASGNYKMELAKGQYTAEVSSQGYKTAAEKIDVQGDTHLDFNLAADEKMLDEVVIVKEQTTIEQKIDKKVINVGRDLLSAGGDATTVLEQLAEIKVDPDGNIALRGSDNVTVLLNGKKSSLSVPELLKQIPASQIYKVEVVTAPSAKYRADGMTGIINIITQKKIKAGLNASAEGNVNTLNGYGITANTSYGNEKFGYRIGLNANNPFFKNESVTNRQGLQPYSQTTDFEFDGKIREVNGGIDYYRSAKDAFTFNFNYTDNQHDLFRDSKILIDGVNSAQINNNPHKHYTFDNSLTYRHDFKEDSFLQLDLRMSKNTNLLTSDFQDNTAVADSDTDNRVSIYDAAADYAGKISDKISFEAGYLYNRIASSNRLSLTGNPGLNSIQKIENIENTHALYVTAQLDFGQWKLQAGARTEFFGRNAKTAASGENIKLDYKNIFPSVHFVYEASEAVSWNFGYNRRTSRPDLYQVLTVQYQNNPFIVNVGNPSLQPEFSNNFEISNHFAKEKFDINTAVSFRKIENSIVNYTSFGSSQQTIDSYKNISGGSSLSLDFSLNLKLFKWMTNTISTNHTSQTFKAENAFANSSGNSASLQFSNQFFINKNLSATLRFSYISKEKSIFSEQKAYSQFQLGARQKLKIFNSEAQIGMRLSDVFNRLSYKGTSFGEGFTQGYYSKPASRVLYFTFSINLDNGKSIKKVEKKDRDFKSGNVG
ncbi:MAG TPA: TonB-dependent receptor, partial [Flavobacterium sp.]|nr:TonB-dependent receptor [Flavobacterium sp.]